MNISTPKGLDGDEVQPHRCRQTVLAIDHDSPPRASATTALKGLPDGSSPQIPLARARKSGCAAEPGGTTRATILSCWVTCTSSPAATHRRISGHCWGNCWTLAVFMRPRWRELKSRASGHCGGQGNSANLDCWLPLISTGLQPGVARKRSRSRFNSLAEARINTRNWKRLKPFPSIPPHITRLKPGANETKSSFRNTL